MIQFKFTPNKNFGNYTPVELNVDLPNDSTMEEILEYFKVFLKSMTFFDFQVETIKIVDDAEDKDDEDGEESLQAPSSDSCVRTQKKNSLNWRLPDKDELNLMYGRLHKKGLGNFNNDYYWSSSEGVSLNAWDQYFFNGFQHYYYKYYDSRVRAVRSFKLQEGEKYKIGQETETGIVFDIQRDVIFECKKEDEPELMNWYEAIEKFGEE